MPHTGGCFCGQVRYTIDAEPLMALMCWCRDCQYAAAGSKAVHFEGEIEIFVWTGDNGNLSRRGYCPQFATILYTRTVGPDHEPVGGPIRIRSGTLDNPDLIAPQFVIRTDSAPNWAHINPDLPQFPRQPTASELGVKG